MAQRSSLKYVLCTSWSIQNPLEVSQLILYQSWDVFHPLSHRTDVHTDGERQWEVHLLVPQHGQGQRHPTAGSRDLDIAPVVTRSRDYLRTLLMRLWKWLILLNLGPRGCALFLFCVRKWEGHISAVATGHRAVVVTRKSSRAVVRVASHTSCHFFFFFFLWNADFTWKNE